MLGGLLFQECQQRPRKTQKMSELIFFYVSVCKLLCVYPGYPSQMHYSRALRRTEYSVPLMKINLIDKPPSHSVADDVPDRG